MIDEVLSAGDMAFQTKARHAWNMMDQCPIRGDGQPRFADRSPTCAIASMWLDHGRIRECGRPEQVVTAYQHQAQAAEAARPLKSRAGTGDVESETASPGGSPSACVAIAASRRTWAAVQVAGVPPGTGRDRTVYLPHPLSPGALIPAPRMRIAASASPTRLPSCGGSAMSLTTACAVESAAPDRATSPVGVDGTRVQRATRSARHGDLLGFRVVPLFSPTLSADDIPLVRGGKFLLSNLANGMVQARAMLNRRQVKLDTRGFDFLIVQDPRSLRLMPRRVPSFVTMT